MFKIALGAGHYLGTPGKRTLKSLDPNETREWVLNDRVCDKVEEKLRAYEGYELLRLDDTTGEKDTTLSERVNAANRWGADFYLSIHHNAGIKKAVRAAELWHTAITEAAGAPSGAICCMTSL